MRLSLVDDTTAIEPLTLDEVKLQVRLPVATTHPEDSLIEDLIIPAVRDRGELATLRSLRQVTWEAAYDGWTLSDGWIELPKPPLVEVLSVTYLDVDGAVQTLAADQYVIDAPTGPRSRRARIAPAFGVVWPSPLAQINAVTIQFTAGYSALPVPVFGSAFPPLLKMALLIDAATLWAHRESFVVGTIVSPMPDAAKKIYASFKSHSTQMVMA